MDATIDALVEEGANEEDVERLLDACQQYWEIENVPQQTAVNSHH